MCGDFKIRRGHPFFHPNIHIQVDSLCTRKVSLHFQPQVQQHFVALFSDQRSTWHGISRIDCFQQQTKFSISYYTIRDACTSSEYCQFVSYRLVLPTSSVIFTRKSFAKCHLGSYQSHGFLTFAFSVSTSSAFFFLSFYKSSLYSSGWLTMFNIRPSVLWPGMRLLLCRMAIRWAVR